MYMYTANQALFARVYMISIATGFFRGLESKDRSQITHTSTTASNIKQVIVAHMVILHTFDRMMSTSSGSFCYFSLKDSNRAHQCLKIMGVLKIAQFLVLHYFCTKVQEVLQSIRKEEISISLYFTILLFLYIYHLRSTLTFN